MASHSSATVREHTPHANQTTRTATVTDALKRRGQTVSNDESIDSRGETHEHHSIRERIEALADIICGAGEESAGALLVLMGQMENSSNPHAIVNTVKHFAFTRCGELNLRGMVDTQIAILESELLANSSRPESAFPTKMTS